MPKRRSTAAEDAARDTPPRRSLRNVQTSSAAAQAGPTGSTAPKAKKVKTAEAKEVGKPTLLKRNRKAAPDPSEELSEPAASGSEPQPPAKKGRTSKQQSGPKAKGSAAAKPAGKANTNTTPGPTPPVGEAGGEKTYWLMKAEPETRLENGVDVKFSIDDLAAKTEPEPWDGIRAYAARNNLRAMKRGDLAFFYHSNCKEPGIVGTMEIVQEHSPDLSAHDPKAPYYDASSKPSDPKWSVVHVEFRSKFAVPITLKELREMGGPGKPLENMQMLKQSRLSVSKVSASEWEHLMSVAKEKVAA